MWLICAGSTNPLAQGMWISWPLINYHRLPKLEPRDSFPLSMQPLQDVRSKQSPKLTRQSRCSSMLPAFHGCCGLPSCTVRSDETDLGPRCVRLPAHQRIDLVHARASADACSLAAAAAAAAIAAMVTTYVCPWWQGPSLQQAASRFFRPPPSRCVPTHAHCHISTRISLHIHRRPYIWLHP